MLCLLVLLLLLRLHLCRYNEVPVVRYILRINEEEEEDEEDDDDDDEDSSR